MRYFIYALLILACVPVQAGTMTIVVSGLGGNAQYDEDFTRYATTIAEEAQQTATQPTDVILLRSDAAKKSTILSLFDNLAAKQNTQPLAIYLIGHGTFDGETYKFNIPGIDITGTELTDALNAIPSTRQLVVVATSASGALLEPLTAQNRVVITATKNGRERNAVRFPMYLVDALATTDADTNKNEIISAAEVFAYTERALASYYESEKLLASEHPRLQGVLADEIEVARYGTLLTLQDSIPPELLSRRELVSQQIDALRSRKEDIDEDSYFDQLQTLMLDLADVQQKIDQSGGSENGQ